MKKVKALLIGIMAVLLITAASVTVLAAPNYHRNIKQNNLQAASCTAVCDGTAKQDCVSKQDCPYYSEDKPAQVNQGQGRRQGNCGGRGAGYRQGRMSGGNGACKMS